MKRFSPWNFENNWYYVNTPGALEALRAHGREITYLIPFWFGITEEGELVDQVDPTALELARQLNLPILAIIHNFASPEYEDLIHTVLTSEQLRANLIENILDMLFQYNFAGINIDFEFIPPEDREYLTLFMTELYRNLKLYGFLVTISVPAQLRDDPTHPFSGAFDYQALAPVSDQIYILAYDEHFSIPGPVASIGFVEQVLSYAVTVIPRDKIRLGMPVYGYDWAEGADLPESLSYNQAISRAESYNAAIIYDEDVQAPTYSYSANGVDHIVWFENVRSFEAKLNLVDRFNLPGIGVWRLGLEDPRIWDLLTV